MGPVQTGISNLSSLKSKRYLRLLQFLCSKCIENDDVSMVAHMVYGMFSLPSCTSVYNIIIVSNTTDVWMASFQKTENILKS